MNTVIGSAGSTLRSADFKQGSAQYLYIYHCFYLFLFINYYGILFFFLLSKLFIVVLLLFLCIWLDYLTHVKDILSELQLLVRMLAVPLSRPSPSSSTSTNALTTTPTGAPNASSICHVFQSGFDSTYFALSVLQRLQPLLVHLGDNIVRLLIENYRYSTPHTHTHTRSKCNILIRNIHVISALNNSHTYFYTHVVVACK